MATGIRAANNLLTTAVFISSLRGATVENSLMIVEWYVVQYLTFWLALFNVPIVPKIFKRSIGSLSVLFLIFSATTIVQCWLYWRGIDLGSKEGCDDIEIFFFTAIPAYHYAWITWNRVVMTVGTIAAPFTITIALLLLFYKFIKWNPNTVEYHEAPEAQMDLLARCMPTGFSAAFAIGFVEKTLAVNNVVFPDTSITDSGQLIPLLIGVFPIVMTGWGALAKLFGRFLDNRSRREPASKPEAQREKAPPVAVVKTSEPQDREPTFLGLPRISTLEKASTWALEPAK